MRSNDSEVDPSTTIADALQLSNLTLQVGGESFHCIINPPRVKDLTLSAQPLAGLWLNADCVAADVKDVEFKWFIGVNKSDPPDVESDEKLVECLRLGVDRCCTKKGVRKPMHFRRLTSSRKPKIRVTEEHVGHIICCVAIPSAADASIPGMPLAAATKFPVTSGPGTCPYHARHKADTDIKFYEEKSEKIRVVSYNILSDGLAETEFSKDGLFPYCPDEFVAWKYRENLLLDEIIGYNADIICLQELDSKSFKGNFYKGTFFCHSFGQR